jgi:hypothetical protein
MTAARFGGENGLCSFRLAAPVTGLRLELRGEAAWGTDSHGEPFWKPLEQPS